MDTDADRVMSYAWEYTNDSYGLVSPEPVEDCVVVKPENEDEILLLETEFSLANDKLELFYLFVPEQESLEILFDKLEGGSFV